MAKERGKRKSLVGIVSSDKMDKTIAVKVTRIVLHRRYKKYVKQVSVYKAHDEKNEARIGDKVEIMECRRLSKTKSWRLVKVLERVPQQV
ncbi:MAG: 30S ribosomal protein S17 [Planctomycetota bacterium]|nr:MAG: 30S ribosomal protein S17 [Planctomycetota bacterium]